MIALEIFYVALSTIAVMVILQLITFVGARMMYPPEPKIIYRDVPVMQAAPFMMPPPPSFPPMQPPIQTLTQPQQEVQLPEYEPRKPASTSLRVDPELPLGLQETRPDGT
jgi:hypothetical protein